MFKKKDPYTFTKFCTLKNGEAGDIIGSISSEFFVKKYDDVQLKDFKSIQKKTPIQKFLLNCTQRINIFNPKGMDLSPHSKLDEYDNYPVMVNASISIEPLPTGSSFQLLDYSPQTINTKVQVSGSIGDSKGKSQGNSTSSTVGSSTSQSNSYGASVTVGATDMGEFVSLSGSVSSNYEHTASTSNYNSSTRGVDSSSNSGNESSNGAGMSIKDWGAYAQVNPLLKNVAWTFGQEYPWDVIECRKTNDSIYKKNSNQIGIVIPEIMSLRLYDQVFLYPPSQLAMFGVNFVMKAIWLVTIEDGVSDEVILDQVINYFSASHCLNTDLAVVVYLDSKPTILAVVDDESLSTTINLTLMALDPLGVQGKNAIVGFIPNKFIIQPTPESSSKSAIAFKIISAANNLVIKDTTAYPAQPNANNVGAGFSASETALTASFAQGFSTLQMTLYFKITDDVNDYTLFMKHWRSGVSGIMLTLVINDDKANPIIKIVDAEEAGGGENNLLSIALRNLNYASVDYHDYLQLGLNSIQITIQPASGQNIVNCGYRIRAISIEGK
jgi:hypothetical protein